jgi:hypothetical protein
VIPGCGVILREMYGNALIVRYEKEAIMLKRLLKKLSDALGYNQWVPVEEAVETTFMGEPVIKRRYTGYDIHKRYKTVREGFMYSGGVSYNTLEHSEELVVIKKIKTGKLLTRTEELEWWDD